MLGVCSLAGCLWRLACCWLVGWYYCLVGFVVVAAADVERASQSERVGKLMMLLLMILVEVAAAVVVTVIVVVPGRCSERKTAKKRQSNDEMMRYKERTKNYVFSRHTEPDGQTDTNRNTRKRPNRE